jgi:hypothetical protein
MLRKCAIIANAVPLVVALGFVRAHLHSAEFADASIAFWVPCEPASPAFKAADPSNAVSKIDSAFQAESRESPVGAVQKARFSPVARSQPLPRTFPPLFHRPPPANS